MFYYCKDAFRLNRDRNYIFSFILNSGFVASFMFHRFKNLGSGVEVKSFINLKRLEYSRP